MTASSLTLTKREAPPTPRAHFSMRHLVVQEKRHPMFILPVAVGQENWDRTRAGP